MKRSRSFIIRPSKLDEVKEALAEVPHHVRA